MSRWISLIVLLGIIAVTGVVLYKVMATFLLPLFLASVLTVIFRPVHAWILPRCNKRTTLAAALTTLVILVTVLAPVTAVFTFAVREGMGAADGSTLDRAQFQLEKFRAKLGLQVPFRELTNFADDEPLALQQSKISLRDVDLAISGLPDQLSVHKEFPTQDLEQIQSIKVGLHRLERGLKQQKEILPELSDEQKRNPESRCVMGLNKSGRFDEAMQLLRDLQETLKWTQEYAYRGDSVLSKPPSLEELRQRYEPKVEDDEQDGDSEDDAIDGPVSVADSGQQQGEEEAGGATREGRDPATPPTLAELKRQFGGLKSTYEAFRMDLMGGPFWAGVLHAANPDVDQIESWRLTAQRSLRGWLPSVAGQATAFLGSVLLGLAIMSLSVFYFLKDGPAMVQSLMRLSPLDDRYERELLIEFDKVSRAVVLATLLSPSRKACLLASRTSLLDSNPCSC